MNPSIRKRLLVVLMSLTLGVWGAGAYISYRDTQKELSTLFDAQLVQIAHAIYALTQHELEEELFFGGHPNGGDVIADFELDKAGKEYGRKVAFQVWIEGNVLALSSNSALKGEPLSDQSSGYSERLIKNKPWRVYALSNPTGSIQIYVAELLDVRNTLATQITLRSMSALWVLLPLLAIGIWIGVGRTMRPLQRVADEVSKRKFDRLQPLSTKRVPEESRSLIDAINELFGRLETAFNRERQFTANAAHELKTPLAALKTHAQLSKMAVEPEVQHEALDKVIGGIDRATHMIEQLLTMARLDPEVGLQEVEQVDLCKIATDIIVDCAQSSYEKNIDTGLDAPESCLIQGSRGAITILMRNLVDNAIRYTPSGGTVDVIIKPDADSVILMVADSGPGIPEEDRQKVFERFYRRDQRVASGSGLGLSIVMRIVELHQGKIEIGESDKGGALFSITFPRQLSDTD